jgi:hypothetical protein
MEIYLRGRTAVRPYPSPVFQGEGRRMAGKFKGVARLAPTLLLVGYEAGVASPNCAS